MTQNVNATLDDFRDLGREHGAARARVCMTAMLAIKGADSAALYEENVVQYLDGEETRLRGNGADDEEILAYGNAALQAFSATMNEGSTLVEAAHAGLGGNRADRRAAKAKARGKGTKKV